MASRGRTPEELSGPGLLTDISEPTGGRHFVVENLSELPDVAAKIGIELRNQYVSDIARETRRVTASTERLVSNWYSREAFRLCTPSGEPATMRRRNNSFVNEHFFAAVLLRSPRFFSCPAGPPEWLRSSRRQPQDSGDAIFSAETRLVPLNVTVSDKAGHLVTNLPQSAFQVFENGVLQPIKIFRREDVPVSLGLIIDNSGSMREKRQAVEAAALALVKDSNPQDEAFIVNFNDDAYLDADFTSDIEDTGAGLTQDRFPRRHRHARRHPDVDRPSEEKANAIRRSSLS